MKKVDVILIIITAALLFCSYLFYKELFDSLFATSVVYLLGYFFVKKEMRKKGIPSAKKYWLILLTIFLISCVVALKFIFGTSSTIFALSLIISICILYLVSFFLLVDNESNNDL